MMTSPSDESTNAYTHVSLYPSFFECEPCDIAASPLGIHLWIGHRYIGWIEGKAVLTNWPEDTRLELPRESYIRPSDDIPF